MRAVPEKAPPLRVLLVDDHEVVRSGVKALLQVTEDVLVSAEAGSGREAIDEADRARPDVVVMDVRLGERSWGTLGLHPGGPLAMATGSIAS